MTPKIKLQEDDVVLCTVKRIQGTTVFLDVFQNGSVVEGTMIFSEVSPGRIRNIREFIAINKKIVCKILRVKPDHVELSLRRVTAGEREQVLEKDRKEKMLLNMLRTVFKESAGAIVEKIKESHEPADFLDEARENPSILKKIAKSPELQQLEKIFAEKRESDKEVEAVITIKSNSPSGIKDIKKALSTKNAVIYYRGSSQFGVSVKAKDFKTANSTLSAVLKEIQEKAKQLNLSMDIKEGKK